MHLCYDLFLVEQLMNPLFYVEHLLKDVTPRFKFGKLPVLYEENERKCNQIIDRANSRALSEAL